MTVPPPRPRPVTESTAGDAPHRGSGLRHVTLTAADLAGSLAFYDAALGSVGLARSAEFGDEEEGDEAEVEAVGYGRPGEDAVVWVVSGPSDTQGLHLAVSAASPAEVDAFVRAALDHGGSVRQAPRRWEIFRRGSYGAQVSDPAGNVVEAVSPE
jgi:catechol 2,3-dioxygenase-like lactoylglutathione lyase family enzyme